MSDRSGCDLYAGELLVPKLNVEPYRDARVFLLGPPHASRGRNVWLSSDFLTEYYETMQKFHDQQKRLRRLWKDEAMDGDTGTQ